MWICIVPRHEHVKMHRCEIALNVMTGAHDWVND